MAHAAAVVATAYCLRGRTASGTYVHRGTVAVEPRQIPLGSSIRIGGLTGRFRAEDTGSAIGWGRIDVWFSSCRRAVLFGRRRVLIRWWA